MEGKVEAPPPLADLFLKALTRSALDTSVAGTESYTVYVTDTPAMVGARTETYKDWKNKYKGAYSNWAKLGLNFEATIPKDWNETVQACGIAVVDGSLVLSASEVEKDEVFTVYKATWARKSRGKSVSVEHGFIVKTGDPVFCHSGRNPAALKRMLHRQVFSSYFGDKS